MWSFRNLTFTSHSTTRSIGLYLHLSPIVIDDMWKPTGLRLVWRGRVYMHACSCHVIHGKSAALEVILLQLRNASFISLLLREYRKNRVIFFFRRRKGDLINATKNSWRHTSVNAVVMWSARVTGIRPHKLQTALSSSWNNSFNTQYNR